MIKKKRRFKSGVIKAVALFMFLNPLSVMSQKRLVHFYNDTVVKYREYTIVTSKTYIRRPLFVKSNITLLNPTDQFLILDYHSAYAVGDDGVHRKFRNNENPTFLPKGPYKQLLRFKRMPKSKSITFHFPKAYVTTKTIHKYADVELPVKVNEIKTLGNISIQVLKITRTDDQYQIRVWIKHEGDNFLAINFQDIYVHGDKSGKIVNYVKENHRMHHRKSKYLEMATLKFPVQAGEKIGNVIYFQNIFSEYELKELQGFDLQYTVTY